MMRESEAAKESGGKESAYYFDILHGRGVAFRHAGRLEESSASFDKLLSEINRDRYPGQYYASLVGAGISMAGSDNEKTVRRSVARFMQVIQFADADNPRIRSSVEDAYIEVARALASLGDQERAIEYKLEYLAKFHNGRYRKAFNSLPPKRF
jgi:tetratricopeptide (TPR) repeat protein